MAEVMTTLTAEFSDLSVVEGVQLGVRLLVAAVLGGILGWERHRAGKAAGLRTYMLVALGSAAFVAVPEQAGVSTADVSRILQGLIAGVGFLGAGCILRQQADGHVQGLTTAAGIWLTAAVGMAAGLGRCGSAIILGVIGWFTLEVLGRLEHLVGPSKPGT